VGKYGVKVGLRQSILLLWGAMVSVADSIFVRTAIPLPIEAIKAWCRQWGIIELALFGSVLRDDFRDTSDIDILVTTDPKRVVTWDDHEARLESLQSIFGRRVDLIERRNLERSVNWYRRKEIFSTARVVYAA
jgi:hypothetical protein